LTTQSSPPTLIESEAEKCNCDGRKPLVLVGCSCVTKAAIQKAHVAAAAAHAAAHRANAIVAQRQDKIDYDDFKRHKTDLVKATALASAAATKAQTAASEAKTMAAEHKKLAKDLQKMETSIRARIKQQQDEEIKRKAKKALKLKEKARRWEKKKILARKKLELAQKRLAGKQKQAVEELNATARAASKDVNKAQRQLAEAARRRREQARKARRAQLRKLRIAAKVLQEKVNRQARALEKKRRAIDLQNKKAVKSMLALVRDSDRLISNLPAAQQAAARKAAEQARAALEKKEVEARVAMRQLMAQQLALKKQAIADKLALRRQRIKLAPAQQKEELRALKAMENKLREDAKHQADMMRRVVKRQARTLKKSAKKKGKKNLKRKRMRKERQKRQLALFKTKLAAMQRKLKADIAQRTKNEATRKRALAAKAAQFFQKDKQNLDVQEKDDQAKLAKMDAAENTAKVSMNPAAKAEAQRTYVAKREAEQQSLKLRHAEALQKFRTRVANEARKKAMVRRVFARKLKAMRGRAKRSVKAFLRSSRARRNALRRKIAKRRALRKKMKREQNKSTKLASAAAKKQLGKSKKLFKRAVKRLRAQERKKAARLRAQRAFLAKLKRQMKEAAAQRALAYRKMMERVRAVKTERERAARLLQDEGRTKREKALQAQKLKQQNVAARAGQLKRKERALTVSQQLKADLARAAKLRHTQKKAEHAQKRLQSASERERKAHERLQREKMKKALRAQEHRSKANGDPIPLAAGITAYRRGFRAPLFTVYKGVCALSGVAYGKRLLTVLGTLPAACRPKGRLSFTQIVSPVLTLRLDVLPSGQLLGVAASQPHNGSVPSGWLPLDGIVFPVNSAQRAVELLPTKTTWQNQGGDFEPLSLSRAGELCVLFGTVSLAPPANLNHWAPHITTLPAHCRPRDGKLSFTVGSHHTAHRVDVLTSGEVRWVSGPRRHSTLSLSGIAFFPSSAANPLPTLNGWSSYGGVFRAPSFKRQGSLCAVSGTVKYETAFLDRIAQLPTDCRPASRLIFRLNSFEDTWRVDVFPNGNVKFIGGTRRNKFVSLDGLAFVVNGLRKRTASGARALVVKAQSRLKLGAGWTAAGGRLEDPSYTRFGPFCLLGGHTRTADASKSGLIAQLPATCLPRRSHVIAVHSSSSSARAAPVKVSAHGKLSLLAGPQSAGAKPTLALSGHLLPTRRARAMPLMVFAPWRPFGSDTKGRFAKPKYFKAGALCVLSGRVRLPNSDSKTFRAQLGRLPSACRPRDGDLLFNVAGSDGDVSVRVQSSGYLTVRAARAPSSLSLSGIAFFAVSASQPLRTVGKGITPKGWRAPSFRRVGTLCAVSGRINGPVGSVLARLPQTCRPSRRIAFTTAHPSGPVRVDVFASGEIRLASNGTRPSFASLTGITFAVPKIHLPPPPAPTNNPPAKSLALSLLGGWKAQRPASFRVTAGRCLLEGLLTAPSGDLATFIAALPPQCRPRARVSLLASTSGRRFVRVDVLPNGLVIHGGGATRGAYLSLSGLQFPVGSAVHRPLSLRRGWVSLRSGYNKAAFVKKGPVCSLTGTVRTLDWSVGKWVDTIAILPTECRPKDGDLILTASVNSQPQRLVLRKDTGELRWTSGARPSGILSLDGISFFGESASQRLHEHKGFSPVSSGAAAYRRPSYAQIGRTCALSGLLAIQGTASKGARVASLPTHCSPAGPQSFLLTTNSSRIQLTVQSSGLLQVTAGAGSGHLSLDGVRFQTRSKAPSRRVQRVSRVGKRVKLLMEGSAFGHGYAVPQMARVGKMCVGMGVAKGKLRRGALFRLPAQCRPSARHVFNTHLSSAKTARLDVDRKGLLRWAGGHLSGSWVSLSSVAFSTSRTRGRALSLNRQAWVPYARGFASPMVHQEGNYCIVSGLIRLKSYRTEQWNRLLGSVPPECRPSKALLFAVNHNEQTHTVSVRPDGSIRWLSGTKRHPFLSLDGIAYFPKRVRKLKLLPNASAFGKGLRVPSYSKVGRFCALSGVVGNAKKGAKHIATLPAGCRPPGRLVFSSAPSGARVDVRRSGRVVIQFVPRAGEDRVSLDGIRFVAAPVRTKRGHVASKAVSKPLKIAKGLRSLPAPYGGPEYTRFGALCLVNGAATGSNLQTRYAQLPRECRPKRRVVFGSLRDGQTASRTDVFSDGTMQYVSGSTFNDWVSFSGMILPVKGAVGSSLVPSKGLVNFGGQYQRASYYVQGDLCALSGFLKIRSGRMSHFNPTLTRLPAACRPDRELIFSVIHDGFFHRLSVAPTGRVSYIAGAGHSNPYISLDGVAFSRNRGLAVTLGKGWREVQKSDALIGLGSAYGYRLPSYKLESNVCFLSGVVVRDRSKSAVITDDTRTVAQLPITCRPNKRLIFAVNQHTVVATFEVRTDGAVVFKSGDTTFGFYSLDGIRFNTQ